jgi:hypothetical protein
MTLIMKRLGLRRVLAACALAVSPLVIAAPAASAAHGTGWLRLAHLSPNTPAVDVYLYSFASPAARVVLRHVSYGTVSPYLPVPAGQYTVAMRPAGAAASSAPVLSTAVRVRAGFAYTVAGMGPRAGLRLQVFSDLLTAPPGRSMIRVIQASMRQDLVTVRAAGQLLARDLAFGSATAYQSVAAGTVTVRAAGVTEHAALTVTLAAGSIHTLVVLDDPGQLKIVSLVDAAGSQLTPTGGPATGLGGTAPRPGPPVAPWLALAAAGMATALVGLIRLRRAPGLSALSPAQASLSGWRTR